MKHLPPLTALRAFEAAARHSSFKSAAAELGVTPTAISHQIRLLEQHCGRPLFRRQPRPLALTSAGAQLFPVVREGLDKFSDALADLRSGSVHGRLRVTATNAFAARWLIPRLPLWRQSHPQLRLDIVGTDAVLNLDAGEADVAIRYCRTPPSGFDSLELVRDTFYVVGSPSLLGPAVTSITPADLAGLPLIEYGWPATDAEAPTWQRWETMAREVHGVVPPLATLASLSFREELHAIEAVIAGQGIAICSDVLVGRALADGTLIQVSDISLPGYGFYITYRSGRAREAAIKAFLNWACGSRCG
jgi:LysR family transcriptional regulator, glycine cleavage system transcriptional activator